MKKSVIISCLILFVLFIVGISMFRYFYLKSPVSADTDQLSEQILRFHVLANSDSEEDQELKLKVKAAVLNMLNPELKDCRTKQEVIDYVNAHTDDIQATALQIIQENGYHYTVSIELGKQYFPLKSYGDLTFPSGTYDALRIQIGDAQGKNWWCVLYPPLCFVDLTHGVVPEDSKEQLSSLLDADTYASLEQPITEKKPEVRLRLLDWLGEWFTQS